ncbi:MAG: hypothetical protein LOD91_08405 [Limnochordales bacterium]|nr:hypothetical protein [Limnochordales bacterium]
MTNAETFTARIQWAGRPQTVTGVRAPDFLVENGRVLVRLEQVSPALEGLDGTALWVPAAQVETPKAFTLRSHLCAIPTGQERDYALRTLVLNLTRYVRDHCLRIELATGMAQFLELSFTIRVPPETATEYLWELAMACRHCQTRPLQWHAPGRVVAARAPGAKERATAAHYVGQLPLWLTTQQFWSVFRWDGEGLAHIVQFSLEERLRRTLQTRFGLAAG